LPYSFVKHLATVQLAVSVKFGALPLCDVRLLDSSHVFVIIAQI